ncbi:MAG: hypothetical protein JXR34_06410 [Bacteroidales bacterium]|nr:hypothetical protein [Bacteroidales bacterium]
MRDIFFNSDYQEATAESCGGKGYNLIKLHQYKPVPDFIILSSGFVKKKLSSMEWLLEIYDNQEIISTQVAEIEDKIGQEIKNSDWTNADLEEILTTVKTLNSNRFAVRSSAADEDSSKMSFAGIHKSFLNISLEELPQAILSCIMSAFSTEAMLYRINNQLNPLRFDFSVVIQIMVEAQASGVAFTMNTQGNMDQIVVVGAYGFGESLVNDKVVSDTYFLSRSSNSISQIIRKNEQDFSLNANFYSYDEPLSKAVFNEDELQKLKTDLLEIETVLKMPADVEFVKDQNHKIWFVQARPITGIRYDEIKILDNTNIAEGYPGLNSTLTISFVKYIYKNVFRGAASALAFSKLWLKNNQTVLDELIASHHGRIYYRLDNWYRMMSLVFSSKASMKSWENAVGISISEFTPLATNYTNRTRVFFIIFGMLINYRRGNKRFFKLFNINYQQLKAQSRSIVDPVLLFSGWKNISEQVFKFWYLSLINDLISFKSFGWMQNRIAKNHWGNPELANDLLSGLTPSDSEKAVMALIGIADAIRQNPSLNDIFKHEPAIVLEKISQLADSKFCNQWQDYIDKYGDRNLAELKLESANFKTNTVNLVVVIKRHLESNLTVSEFKNNQLRIRKQAEEKIRSQCSPWNPQFWLFLLSRKICAYGLINRENMRFARSRIFGETKEVFLKIGQNFLEAGLVNHKDDIFFLTIEEVEKNLIERSDMRDLIERRKLDFEKNKTINPADRIIYQTAEPPEDILASHFQTGKNSWQGVAVSNGTVEAEAIVITSPHYDMDVKGKIIVCQATDPGWFFLMAQAKGIVAERGSLLSHTAILGRELGIPTVVGIENITKQIQNGDVLIIDGSAGLVRLKDFNSEY